MRRYFLRSYLVLAQVLSWSASGRAQTFSLELDGESECATRETLKGQVVARISQTRVALSTVSYHFQLRIAAQSVGSVIGTLGVRSPQGKTSFRTIDGDTCEEVASALALIMALTIDPSARTGPIDDSSETAPLLAPAAPQPQQETAEELPSREALALAPSRPTKSIMPAVPRSAPTRPPYKVSTRATITAPQTTRAPVRLAVGAQVDWSSLLGPGIGMLSPGVHGTLLVPSGPIATLALSVSPTTHRRNEQGLEATLAYYGARLDLGWPVVTAKSLALNLLSVVSIGRVRAEGVTSDRVAVSREATATWLGVGPGAELRHNLAWGGWSMQVAAPIAISRPDFYLVKNGVESREFHKVSTVGLELSLRLFLRCLG